MSFDIIPTPKFEKELKRLAKKFPSLKKEYFDIIQELQENPKTGTNIGYDCFKIRISIASKGKGKSGGARIITCVKVLKEMVVLISIYDKSEQENISDKELRDRLESENL